MNADASKRGATPRVKDGVDDFFSSRLPVYFREKTKRNRQTKARLLFVLRRHENGACHVSVRALHCRLFKNCFISFIFLFISYCVCYLYATLHWHASLFCYCHFIALLSLLTNTFTLLLLFHILFSSFLTQELHTMSARMDKKSKVILNLLQDLVRWSEWGSSLFVTKLGSMMIAWARFRPEVSFN